MKLFEDIYQENYTAIFRFCHRILGSMEDAEDMTQTTFVKTFTLFKYNSNIQIQKALLYRIAAHTCFDKLRKKSRSQKYKHEFNSENIRDTKLEDKLIREEETSLLRLAIDQLPMKQRMLIMLYKDGFSYSEMSMILKIKQTSIGKTISRIISKLEKDIKQGE